MIAQGSPSSLKDRLGGDRITLRIREFTPESEVETAKNQLSSLPFVQEIIINQAQGNSLNLIVKPQNNSLTTIEKNINRS